METNTPKEAPSQAALAAAKEVYHALCHFNGAEPKQMARIIDKHFTALSQTKEALAKTKSELADLWEKFRHEASSALMFQAASVSATQECHEAKLRLTQLAETNGKALARAEASLAEWRTLCAWGATPDIIHEWIKGQQARIYAAQDLEQQLAQSQAREASLARALQAAEKALNGVALLGEVYTYPEGWKSAKMGGGPDIQDYDCTDLSHLVHDALTSVGEALARHQAAVEGGAK